MCGKRIKHGFLTLVCGSKYDGQLFLCSKCKQEFEEWKKTK